MYHATINPESCPALVLNADYRPLSYYPLSVWCWQDAVKAVFLDRVNIVSEYDRVVHSPSLAFRLPSVVSLKIYVKPARHPAFTLRNPNKVYALLGSFGVNQVNFHAADGSGYRFMTEQALELDAINPQVASRMVRNFERYRRYEPGRRALMRAALEQIAAKPGLSKETGEVVGKALA